jgi:hypothetical protein
MRSSRNFSAQWLSLVLASAHVGAAHAQSPGCPGPASAVATEAARSAFREGQTAFNEGDYARAVDLWQSAYTKDCTAHALLLNLATAQELAGRPRDAIHSLALYNERVPGSSYHEPNRRRIERLQQLLAAPPPPAPATPPAAAPSPAPPPAPNAASAVPVVVTGGSPPAPVTQDDTAKPSPSPLPSSGENRSLLPLGVAAVGAAASLIGGVLYVSAVVSSGTAAERCGGPRTACVDPDAVADGEAARARAHTAGWITTVGVATALGGVVWYLVQPSAPARTTSGWRWDAHVARSSGLLSATCHF